MSADLSRAVDSSDGSDNQTAHDSPRHAARHGRRGRRSGRGSPSQAPGEAEQEADADPARNAVSRDGRQRRQPKAAAAGDKPAALVALAKSDEHASAAEHTANDVLLRSDVAPVDARDFEDRHRHRATSSDQMLHRYIKWDDHQTKLRWQHLALGVVALIAFMVLFLSGTVVLVRLIPGMTPPEGAMIVRSTLFAASGGLAFGGLVTYLVKRHRLRG